MYSQEISHTELKHLIYKEVLVASAEATQEKKSIQPAEIKNILEKHKKNATINASCTYNM